MVEQGRSALGTHSDERLGKPDSSAPDELREWVTSTIKPNATATTMASRFGGSFGRDDMIPTGWTVHHGRSTASD